MNEDNQLTKDYLSRMREKILAAAGYNPSTDYENPLNMAAGAANVLDSVTGAPTRAALGAMQEGGSPMEAAQGQFLENPSKAPTGEQLLERSGVENELAKTVGGFGLDIAADPTNLIPGKAALGGLLAAGTLKKGAKRATTELAEKIAAKNPKKFLHGNIEKPSALKASTTEDGTIAVRGGKDVGASGQFMGGEYDWWFQKETNLPYENPAILESIEVDPKKQGKGLGSQVLKQFEQEAKKGGADGIFLNASPQGAGRSGMRDESRIEDLIRFYEKHGYKIYEREPNNAVMIKDLRKNVAEKIAAKGAKGLDLSEAARMKRAKEMGFDTEKTYYHGTPVTDIEAFDPYSTQGGAAGFFTTNPKFAEQFTKPLQGTHYSGDAVPEKFAANIIPAHLKVKNPFDYENAKHLDKVFNTLPSDTLESMAGELPRVNGKPMSKAQIKQQFGMGSWGLLERPEVVDAIKNLGFDSMHVYEGGQKNIAVFKPEQIRSKFAAFDKKKKKSGNIAAGVAGAALLGKEAAEE